MAGWLNKEGKTTEKFKLFTGSLAVSNADPPHNSPATEPVQLNVSTNTGCD